jgi:hypothetical protein
MTEEIHQAFWTYRITYFEKIGALSRAYRGTERNLIKVLRLQGVRKRLARSLIRKREEEEKAVEGFANKYRVLLQQGLRFFVKYVVCLPLGLVTFGTFWTKDIRKFVFYNHSDMGSDQFEMLQEETESLKAANITLLQLQEKQSEQTAFVLAQMASVREENLKLVELQEKQSEQTTRVREDNLRLAELQEKQSEQMTFVLAQMASVREDNSKLVELQMKQSENIADMRQKQAADMMLLIETCQRLGSIKQESE